MSRVRRLGLALALSAWSLTAACDHPAPARATLSVAATLADADTAGFERATAPRAFTFPADHGPHPGFRHEWWYFTGNLATEAGRPFGFQLTVFRTSLRPDTSSLRSDWATNQAFMGHLAISDIAAEEFHAFESFERGALGLAGASAEPFRVWIGDWIVQAAGEAAPGAGGVMFAARATADGVGLELSLEPTQDVVLQGIEGLSRKGPEPGNASYYYSLPRLRATGAVTVGGRSYPVTGSAWLDREWGTSALGQDLAGWDWFALQLDDGSELMYYRLRDRDGRGAPLSAGTFVRPDGRLVRLTADDVALDETAAWTSPRGTRYPAGWRLRIPAADLDLAIEPRLADQELDLAFRYWEGAVEVEGSRAGEAVGGLGYVELAGYADAPPREQSAGVP